MKTYLPFIFLAFIFFFIKLNGIGIRLSDSNIYFYTAYQMLQGQTLYKDIFFTNFPFLPYMSVLYFLLFSGNLPLYNFTAILEALVVSFFLYRIVITKYQNILLGASVATVYLFSFIVLATSDHQSGVFLASVFAIASYYFSENKRLVLSGICIALSLMTKAYFIPIFLALSISHVISEKKKSVIFFVSFLLIVLVILVPSLLFARDDLYKDIISYSLSRSQGLSKFNILRFFVTHDALLTILFCYSLLRFKKNLFMSILSLCSILFITLYKDIYYLYLNFFIPFLALTFADFSNTITNRFHVNRFILPTILVVIAFINIGIYLSSYQRLQKLEDYETIVTLLKKQPNTVLYGTNDITAALAYLSDKKLLGGIIDTNENIFRKGYLNSSQLTKDAISQNAILITHGAYYPQFNVEDRILGGIFDREQVTSSCEMIASYPVTTEGIENRLNLFSCQNSTHK